MAVKRDESAIVSGGGDSVVQVWRDATAEEAAERMKEAELLLERYGAPFLPSDPRQHVLTPSWSPFAGSKTWPTFCR